MNTVPEIIQIRPEQRHKRQCDCAVKCTDFYRVNGFDVYCKGKLEQLAIDILNKINGTNIAQGNKNNRGWTLKQESMIIDYLTKNGVEFGTYRIIGEMIGKPRESVKRKVYNLQKRGLINLKELKK